MKKYSWEKIRCANIGDNDDTDIFDNRPLKYNTIYYHYFSFLVSSKQNLSSTTRTGDSNPDTSPFKITKLPVPG